MSPRKKSVGEAALTDTSSDYQCPTCSENLPSKELFDIHMSGHSNNLKCAVCNMVLKSMKNYEKHCQRCKPYECQICGRVVRFRPNFIKHMRVHTGEDSQRLKYKCEVCNKEFMSFEYFKVHKKIHSQNLNLTCKVCGKVFSALASLRGHMKLHTGMHLHTCDVCGKRFGQRYNLKIHTRVHTGQLPFECSMCKKKFHTESSYENHLHTHQKPSEAAEIHLAPVQTALPKEGEDLLSSLQLKVLPNTTADGTTVLIKEESIDDCPSDIFNVPVASRMKTISDFLASSSASPPTNEFEDSLNECSELPYSNIFDIDSVSQGIPATEAVLEDNDLLRRTDSKSQEAHSMDTTDGNFIRKEWVYASYGVGSKLDDEIYCPAESFIYE